VPTDGVSTETDPQPETELEPQPEDGVEPERPEPEPELDPETVARRDAALAQIRSFGDPVLRTKARPIERFDDALREEVERMGHLMDDALGVGLAATQVGVVHRLLVYRVMQGGPLAALINPEIEWSGRESEAMEEGCLSLPGVLVEVDRPLHVRVHALNEYGEPIKIEATGLEARVIQHEMDHLDGVLILDRASREQRKDAMRVLREGQQAA
jgi:peptide deformylase